MLQKDIQSKLAVVVQAAMTTFTGGAVSSVVKSAAIDTKGFDAISIALNGSRVITEADALLYSFESCETTDGTYVAEESLKSLPNRKEVADLEVEVSPYTQTVGVFSSRRFVKLVLTGVADTVDYTCTPVVILRSKEQEFTGYSSTTVPGDGKA